MRRSLTVGLVAVAAVAATGAVFTDDEYTVSVLAPTAANVVPGGAVLMNGVEVGAVEDIEVRDGKALLTLRLADEYAPLHDGAIVSVEWKALLGERRVVVTDGDPDAAEVPDGGLLKGSMPKNVEIDEVLNALDADTRKDLASLVNRLGESVSGNEADLRATLNSAGPAVGALGEVLRAVGTDGPAIKNLVRRLNAMVATLADRETDLRAMVQGLADATAGTVGERENLSRTLRALPSTLRSANGALRDVPDTVDAVVPLVEDVRPVTRRLPSVAKKLSPVLADLRGATAQLRPTLGALDTLLGRTPGLLDNAHAVVPGVDTLLSDLTPAVDFLRPYTPELAGFLANWGSANANYDAKGHYARIFIQEGASTPNVNPGVTPPGVSNRPYPVPGELEGQPWTDAYGGKPR